MDKSIPYHIDLTNNLMPNNRLLPGEDRSNISYTPIMELAAKNDTAMIKYLYDNNYLGKYVLLNSIYSYPAVFKYFVPSIIPLAVDDILMINGLIHHSRHIGGHNLSSADHEKFREVEFYLLSLHQ
jgi:hypothetical protein